MHTKSHFTLHKTAGYFISATLLVIGFSGGVMMTKFTGKAAAYSATSPENVDLSPLWKAWETIDEKFVPAAVSTSSPIATTTEEINRQRVYGLIAGLAASLNDPYTFFLPPVQNKEFAADMKGSFEGVGMEIDVRDGILTVVSPLKKSPAAKAGILAGDKIIKIDGTTTEGLDTTNAVQRIRGPKGTVVVLTVVRDGWSTPKEIRVTRDVITVPIVDTTAREDGIFVIQLATFTQNSPDLFRQALREFVESGDHKLILDLRGNPGGYLEAAVNIGSWFIPAGSLIVTEDYAGHQDNVYHRSYGYDIFNKNLKMMILVDKGSASASEILSDALRYYGVAKLVGTNTFGKGSVQELVPITADTSLKVTVARWLGPDGIQIPREGIKPDYEVTVSDEDRIAGVDPQMEKAVELLGGKVTKIVTSSPAAR